jgi:hypothetical protein
MLNLKQEQLAAEFVEDIRKNFPEVQLINITPSPENPDDLWIRVTAPKNEEREFELMDFCSNKTMDILLDYGYHMLVLPLTNSKETTTTPDLESSAIAR